MVVGSDLVVGSGSVVVGSVAVVEVVDRVPEVKIQDLILAQAPILVKLVPISSSFFAKFCTSCSSRSIRESMSFVG